MIETIEYMREHNPPFMTLINFDQGSFKRLWNLEVGDYEDFNKIEDIEWCGWMIRSKQDTLYSLVPKVTATVYHMEFFGEFKCGRCVEYKYFTSRDKCLAAGCKKMAKPHRAAKDMQMPPIQSRYKKWTGVGDA